MQLLFWPVGGVSEDAGGFAAGFLQVLPLAVPAWDSDPKHTNRPRRLLGESGNTGIIGLQFIYMQCWSCGNNLQVSLISW